MGLRSKFVTRKFRIFGDKNAGSDGPIRICFIPSDNSDNRITTAFCSYQERIMESGRSLTPHSKAPARASAIWRVGLRPKPRKFFYLYKTVSYRK